MKGDLHTLKKVSMYVSKVMLAGTVVLSAITVALVVLGIGSFFSGWMSDMLQGAIGCDLNEDSSVTVAASYCKVLLLFVLALITVHTISKVTVSIHSEHSPFVEPNVFLVKRLSVFYLVFAVAFLAAELLKGSLPDAVFMFFGCLLVSVVLYMFALIIRYGGLLQDESDRTL